MLILLTAALYNLGPATGGRGLRGLPSWGVIAAVLVWVIASAGFEVWVGSFADYDATYGAVAGGIAFVVWLWISNLALLFGMVLDIELEVAAPP